MIKFWIDDFKYVKRYGVAEPFGYSFNVRSDSANYLINKYGLDYPQVFIDYYEDKTVYVGSRQYDNKKSNYCKLNEDDVDEIYNLLRPIIDIDKRNYEDYMCDDWYKKDDRWDNKVFTR